MKKRFLTLLAALAVCLSLTVTALAAGTQFSDVPANHWAGAEFE